MKRKEICDEITIYAAAPLTPKNAEMLDMLLRLKKEWPFTDEENWAGEWVEKMNPKARWTWQEIRDTQKACGDKSDTTLMWAAMNATWSDMGGVLEELGITHPVQVLKLARAFWLEDKDAVEEKMKRYYEEIVKR